MAFPVADRFIVAAEQMLGRQFPRTTEVRLARSNGGEIEAGNDDWVLPSRSRRSDRKRLARSANDISRETELDRGGRAFRLTRVRLPQTGRRLVGADPRNQIMFIVDHETGQLALIEVRMGLNVASRPSSRAAAGIETAPNRRRGSLLRYVLQFRHAGGDGDSH